VRQPTTLRGPEIEVTLGALSPDVIVVAAYGLLLPQAVLDIPTHSALNVHASLLPRWRGAAPIQRAILSGDEVTGVSIMRMEAGLDTGPYCESMATDIGEKSAEDLTRELADLGACALMRALERVGLGTCVWNEQDESQATYASKVLKSDVLLSPDLTSSDFVRRVRASSRHAPARLAVGEAGLTVTAARLCGEHLDPGRVAVVGPLVLFGASDAP
jgi:methionyl-tRNA formyltransferase